jgi:Skp family chaperone for outer membrane proteins
MKPVFALLVAIGVSTPAVGQVVQSRSTASIAYISVGKILSDSVDGKAATKRLEALRQAKAQEVGTQQKALEATRTELANAGGLFQATRRAQLRAQENRQQTELQQAAQRAQSDLQNLQRELQADLRKKLAVVLADLAKRRAIQIVLNEDSAVVWAPPGTDLTAEVLDRLNAATLQTTAK